MSENKKPKISVLILSYNHFNYLEKCIESIFLNQSEFYEIEIIVLDDGSDDGSVALLRRIERISPIEFKLILKQHGGVESIAKNFNEMVELASGDFITFLASDDQYTLGRFNQQLAIMEVKEDCVVVFANGENRKSGKFLGHVHPGYMKEIFEDLSGRALLNHVVSTVPTLFIQSILVRSQFIKNYAPFDIDLIADDWVFNIKLLREVVAKDKRIDYVDKVVFIRNIHESNTSHNYRIHFLRMDQVADKYTIKKQKIMMEVVARGLARGVVTLDYKRFSFYFKKALNHPILLVNAIFSILGQIFKYNLKRNY
jgi:glycosyltransferase involved in cell wall biosynthesis